MSGWPHTTANDKLQVNMYKITQIWVIWHGVWRVLSCINNWVPKIATTILRGSSLGSPGPMFPGCKGLGSGLGLWLGWGLNLNLTPTITNRRRDILTNHRRIRGKKGGTCPYHPTKKRFAHRVLWSPVTYKAGNIGPGEHRYTPILS